MTGPPPPVHPVVPPPREEVPSLPEVVRFLVRYRWWIFGGALAATLGTLVVVGLVLAPRYQSVATLVVAPTKIPGNVRPAELTVQGYERLLASDTVLAETRRRLVEDGTLEPEEELGIGGRLEIRLVVAERTEAALAPTLELVARASKPDAAAAIANTWAAVFLDLARDLLTEAVGSAGELATEDFQRAEADIERLQAELTRLAEDRSREVASLDSAWARKVEAAESSSERRVAAQRERLSERLAEHGRESQRALGELAAREESLDEALGPILDEVVRLRARLAESPEVVVLARAQGAKIERVEELNPLYGDLTMRLSEVEGRLRAARTAGGEGDASGLERLLRALERLQRERTAGYSALQNEGLDELASIQRKGIAEVAALARRAAVAKESAERRHRQREETLTRDLREAEERRRQLAPAVQAQRLAGSPGEWTDVRLGSAAKPAPAPTPRRVVAKAAVAAILGALLGLAAAVVREIARAVEPTAE